MVSVHYRSAHVTHVWVCSFIATLNRLGSSIFISKAPVFLFTLEHEQIIPDLASSASGLPFTFSQPDCKGHLSQPQPVTELQGAGMCMG